MTKKTANEPVALEDPVATARAEVNRLNDAELQFAMLYRQKAEELASARAQRGDQVLDAANPEGAAREAGQRASAMREELESLADASKRARERRIAAIPAVFAAEADEAELKAAQLENDAANLEAESGRLRKALEAHDDWNYVAADPVIPERMIGGQQGGSPVEVDARGPRHERLRVAARSLRSKAAQDRYKVAHQAGMLEADTVEELFAAVHNDPMRVGPPVDAIISWAEKATEAEQRRRVRIASTADGFAPIDAPITLRLEWRAGAIDQAQSRVVQTELLDHVIQRPNATTPTAPAANVSRRPESDRLPFDTSATPYEIAREAANTGQSIGEVAEQFGVPVPASLSQPVEGK